MSKIIEQGHGCRFCEIKKTDLCLIECEVTCKSKLNSEYYQVWRCDKCGAYWSEFMTMDSNEKYGNRWFCFGRDTTNIKRHRELYQKIVHPKPSKLQATDWRTISKVVTTVALIFTIFVLGMIVIFTDTPSKKMVNKIVEPVAVERPLMFEDVRVTHGATTILDLRAGYLTNHTVIIFLDETNVVQYGQQKNLCYTSNLVTVVDP